MPRKSLSFLIATIVVLFLPPSTSGQREGRNRCHVTLDFEDNRQRNCLSLATNQETARISFSTSIAKYGHRSLKWESGDTTNRESILRYERPRNAPINQRILLNGGIKMWIYRETPAKERIMEVRLRNRRNQLGMFTIDMGFKGWRAIWVSYAECKNECDSLNPPAQLTSVDFVLTHSDTIFFDLVEFVRGMSLQSRDKLVPPFTKFGSMYDASEFWQRSYHWSQQTPTVLPTTVDPSKTLSLTHIESRLKNWYCDETQTSYDFKGNLKLRWEALTRSFAEASNEYDRLDFKEQPGETVIGGPPLFCRNCEQGTRDYSSEDPTRKFSFITTKVLLPLALEFYLKSRQNELSKTVTKETTGLNSKDIAVREKSLQKISKTQAMRDAFSSFLNARKQGRFYTEQDVRHSLEYINKVRLQRIINLLDYLEDQGWADGSGIGSLDHEMNRNGAGYMHTLFLLKDSLHQSVGNRSRLLSLIKTAKWYNDFGEVYQTSFEYNGTTADRMITIMLFRLMIVLIMPTCSEDELKARQRDMDALKRWMDNALAINKAFGGVIKPDYIGFHHKAFYASAYTPHALHTAAQVQYLLEGTDYALSEASKRNLRLALQTLRMTAVKYSTPSSVGGRVVDFSKAILINILPAYAYISVSHTGPLPEFPDKGFYFTKLDMEAAGMFQRLYQPSNTEVRKYLKNGRVQKGKTYMNSLGSLQIMSLVDSKSPNAEVSPEGHWSKNFAALSIHRRKDWAVTVKGFNRFVWDFEGSTGSARPENVFGTFASHGSMLIANSEEVLKAHDINNGWDWTKIPGATTMSLTLPQIRLRKARNFSPRSFAGGVSYKGTASLPSGVFGMDFHQPNYQFQEERHPHPSIKLHFKKSVFFYQNLVVCLGSNIIIENGGDTKAQTTLFQDKLNRGGDSTFFIKVDDARKDSMDQFATMNPLSKNRNKKYTTLIDTKGNNYYIPESSAKNLRVHVQTQNSQTPAAEVSSGIYATAWIEHTSPNGFYEYAIWINTDSYPNTAEKMWARQTQENNPRPYQILKQDDEAHVVQFNVIPESGKNRPIRTPLYGYVFFKSATPFYEQGPIEKVNMQCRIMAEETVNFVYLSVSYPDLNFPLSKVIESSSDIKVRELFQTESNEMELVVTLKNDVLKCSPEVLKVFGSPTGYVPHIRVESSSYYGSGPYKGNIIVFSNLKNGFSVEVKFKNA